MNDRIKTEPIKLASTERKNPRLVEDFTRAAKAEREAIYASKITEEEALSGLCNLFKILLERSGYPLIEEGYTQDFWQEVRTRMSQYLKRVEGLKTITKIEEDLSLDEWASDKVAEYRRLIHGPAPLNLDRGGFGASVMRMFR